MRTWKTPNSVGRTWSQAAPELGGAETLFPSTALYMVGRVSR